MSKSSPCMPAATATHDRILSAAFEAFAGEGYDRTSTLDIAKRAKVSKRDLYAKFGSKHDVLVACIKNRAQRMQLLPDLPPASILEPVHNRWAKSVAVAQATLYCLFKSSISMKASIKSFSVIGGST
jgi:AcrR family transcriptional regulator